VDAFTAAFSCMAVSLFSKHIDCFMFL